MSAVLSVPSAILGVILFALFLWGLGLCFSRHRNHGGNTWDFIAAISVVCWVLYSAVFTLTSLYTYLTIR